MIIVEEKYMRRALQIACNGRFHTSPNPMVGAVIVHSSGKIIGEGYHRQCGSGHAEVNAIASVKERALFQDSTIYVTLEPCAHYGKTPPCSQLIIDSKIPRVVVGCTDPFAKVSGRGISMLKAAGIEVVTGVLTDECRALNRRFIISHTMQRPMITLKWAQSKDGFMDHRRMPNEASAKFSTPITSMLVHRLRAEHDAIIAGSNTITTDNPRLDTRLWDGNSPRIIIMDHGNIISPEAHIFQAHQKPIYLGSLPHKKIDRHTEWLKIDCDENLSECMTALYKYGITSLFVEGGATLLHSFIKKDLWDTARVETSPIELRDKGRIQAPFIAKSPSLVEEVDGNLISFYENHETAK